MTNKHDDIKKALAGLDKKSKKHKEKKENIQVQIKKQAPSLILDEKEKKIKLDTEKANQELWDNLKDKLIFWICLVIIVVMFVSTMSREKRTTLIEHIIFATLIGGMVASHARNYRLFLPVTISSFIYNYYSN